jgi:ubiquitin-conjugating enzyme E2 D/E
MSTNKRLVKEMKDMESHTPDGVTAGPISKDNLYNWSAFLIGPKGTPYEGGMFKLSIDVPKTYPFKAPKIKFITPIYHCNINGNGDICLDILKDQWSPSLTIESVLLSIQSLLDEPNPDDPLVPDIAHLFKNDRLKHDMNAKQYTIENSLNK